MRVCNELRQEIYGTTVLTHDMPRPAFSLEIKSLIYEVCRKNIEAFCLADKKKVWTKPYIGPNRDIPLWSVGNPYAGKGGVEPGHRRDQVLGRGFVEGSSPTHPIVVG